MEEARERLTGLYRAVEGELDWTDIDYWSRTLGLDVPALKASVRHRIAPHPDALLFLGYLQQRHMRVHLVTNAHPKSLAIKMEKTGVDKYLDRIVEEAADASRPHAGGFRLEIEHLSDQPCFPE